MKKIGKHILCALLIIGFVLCNFQGVQAATSFVTVKIDNKWVNGNIGKKGEEDLYKITIQKDGWLTIDFQAMSLYYARVQILDSDMANSYVNKSVDYGSETSPASKSITLALEKGTYVIRVYGWSDYTGTYRLRANFEAANNNENSNIFSFETAQTLTNKKQVVGFLSEDVGTEFYRVQVNKKQPVKIIFIGRTNTTMEIWNQDLYRIYDKDIYASEASPTRVEYEETLQAGTYYIKIMNRYSVGRYSIEYQAKVLAERVSISGAKDIVAGQSLKLSGKISPSNVSSKKITWKSSNEKIATINKKTGELKGLKAGRVTITATASDGSGRRASVSIVVKPKKMAKMTGRRVAKAKATLAWRKQAGVTGYQIQYSGNKTFKKYKLKTVTSKTDAVTIKKLSGKKQYFRIRGYVKVNNRVYYGTWSDVKKIKLK